MTRPQLEHIIRAATADTDEIVIVGSQSILGAYPDAREELVASMEADVFPRERPADSILIDGAIGEKSIFHETFGYYAHGVDETTAVLPAGWRDRLIRVQNKNTRHAIGWCLETHDLAVSKLVAGREKDISFLTALLRHRLVVRGTVESRLAETEIAEEVRLLCEARWQRIAASIL